ncbi:MAG: hypothetical protein M1834_001037 [Cirrosporium novae-zelandiae]|nr:MAG: hypothetical protein M1834_001037 [Cirrosporium novae-zelandiae]
MTRPHMIRADTMDLQDQNAPSAQDHSRQPSHPAPIGEGSAAPHQASTLKMVEQESTANQNQSPRSSTDEERDDDTDYNGHGRNPFSSSQDDDQQQNGGYDGMDSEDAELADAEGDDDLLDDDMDKISSSPSIEDGGCSLLPPLWPNRADSLQPLSTPPMTASPNSFFSSSSPYLATPEYFPLSEPVQNETSFAPEPMDFLTPQIIPQIVHVDEDNNDSDMPESYSPSSNGTDYEDERRDRVSPLMSEQLGLGYRSYLQPNHNQHFYDSHYDNDDDDFLDVDDTNLYNLLLPADDPLLDNSFDDAPISPISPVSSESSEFTPSWDEDDASNQDDDFSFSDSRFIDSGWGGECLQDTEDIDFEFVYALHTFVATVEGQANATKGDTMVLLDDSNSYWWLVRVVKDGSIGYLPAEHIETPTERLARLNKHRNIDLSQTMLGDNPEKSKNPLKKAMRRRTAKTVTFTAPTYVEASDVDYSSSEDDEPMYGDQEDPVESQVQEVEQETRGEMGVVEPLRVRDRRDGSPDKQRNSEDGFDRQGNAGAAKSRNGIVRNTDSFFKDDTVETKKISLTPKLLSDDSNGAADRDSNDKTRGSLDTFDKITADKTKDKKKDKKPGMLSGLFKRKDKKKSSEEDIEVIEKLSGESARSLGSKESLDSIHSQNQDSNKGARPPASQPQAKAQRQHSKLQKVPPDQTPGRNESSPSKSDPDPRPRAQPPQGILKTSQPQEEPAARGPQNGPPQRPPRSDERGNMQNQRPTVTLVTSNSNGGQQSASGQVPERSLSANSNNAKSPSSMKQMIAGQEAEPISAMDSFDSTPETEETNPLDSQSQSSENTRNWDKMQTTLSPITEGTTDTLLESPVEVSPVYPDGKGKEEAAAGDKVRELTTSTTTTMSPTTANSSRGASPLSSASSPSLISPTNMSHSHPTQPPLTIPKSGYSPIGSNLSHSPSPSTTPLSNSPPTPLNNAISPSSNWSDSSLRVYMDTTDDVKDLLIIVHDTGNVRPAGPDHPVTGGLFAEERKRLGEMGRRLDGLLEGWVGRRTRSPVRAQS